MKFVGKFFYLLFVYKIKFKFIKISSILSNLLYIMFLILKYLNILINLKVN
jgi:hypothetical protein